MIFIKTSQKMIIVKDNITLITTEYKDEFGSLSTRGRTKKDFNNMSGYELNEKKKSKIKRLRNKIIRDIENICDLNVFKYYVTIHVNTREDYKKLMNRLKKADKGLKFLSLAAWSFKSDLHYHILIDSTLSLSEVTKRLYKLKDYDIQVIRNKKLVGYFRKNIVDDIIKVLNSEDEELRDKQIEILKFEKILSYSRNIIKPEVKIIESIEDLKELERAEHQQTKEYTSGSSRVIINKFLKNDDNAA